MQSIPRLKKFLTEAKGVVPRTVWQYSDVGHTQEATKRYQELVSDIKFDTPKPPRLIRHMLRISTSGRDDDELVLDFFAGSGTTAQSAIELNTEDGGNRKFILVQLPEPTEHPKYPTIADLCRERVRRVIQQQEPETPTVGFRALKLTSSNFKVWDADQAPQAEDYLARQLELYADHMLPDRTQQDVLYELILKFGLELTVSVVRVEVPGGTGYLVADGALLICLENRVTEEMLRAMAGYEPVRVVCLDQAFGGNDQLKTNTALEMQAHGIEFRTV